MHLREIYFLLLHAMTLCLIYLKKVVPLCSSVGAFRKERVVRLVVYRGSS